MSTVLIPALAWLLNLNCRSPANAAVALANCWVAPELFTIPTPVNWSTGTVWEWSDEGAEKVKALAPGLKTILSTTVVAENVRLTALETPKVATSPGPFGTVAGVQFVAVFQSPLVGLRFQVALPPNAVAAAKSREKSVDIADNEQGTLRRSQGAWLRQILRDEVVFVS